jgi:hypothetical protein
MARQVTGTWSRPSSRPVGIPPDTVLVISDGAKADRRRKRVK